MNWRRWNHVIHRDLGFLCVGLTLLYAVSGVAVNHMADWNPNYRVEKVNTHIPPPGFRGVATDSQIRAILGQLGETGIFENSFQPDPENLWLFVEGRVIRVNLASGAVEHERAQRRPLLYPLNFLHLNHPKKGWTPVADLYAAALALLAVSGLLMLPRQRLLKRRGLCLTAAGVILPLFYLVLYY